MLPQFSAWDTYPTDENRNQDSHLSKYKFTSVELVINKDLYQISRQTYGLLDWLGDCGGLFDALLLIGEIMVTPFATYALNSSLVSKLVREQPRD